MIEPYYSDKKLTVFQGDVLDGLAALPDNSIHCCVTSPPYWNLRDYKVDGQIGMEPTPEAFVENLIAVFSEVRRVLHPSGTCWLNIGDSYAGSNQGHGTKELSAKQSSNTGTQWMTGKTLPRLADGLKPKDLCLIPARLSLALQADGWFIRSHIAWCKKAPMPESVQDRPTSAWESIFLLSKAPKYFYDTEAVREERQYPEFVYKDASGYGDKNGHARRTDKQRGHSHRHAGFNDRWDAMPKAEQMANGRNLRNFWLLGPEPYPEAHFATFPSEVPRRAIKAGTSEWGCCPECLNPWTRTKEPTPEYAAHLNRDWADYDKDSAEGRGHSVSDQRPTKRNGASLTAAYVTTGWQPTCKHNLTPIPCTVLDPFGGSFTTCQTAIRLGRRAVAIELNPSYVELGMKRCDAVLSQSSLFDTLADAEPSERDAGKGEIVEDNA